MIEHIGARLRSIRKKKKMTLSEIAKVTELSVAYLSNLERDLCSPTLDYLQRICAALGVSMTKLLDSKNWGKCVIRGGEKDVVFEEKDRIRYESSNFGSGKLEGLIITVQPKCEFEKTWTHAYDEIGLVLEGELTITIDNQEWILVEGDSFYIEAMMKHNLSNHADEPCVSYWVKQSRDEMGW